MLATTSLAPQLFAARVGMGAVVLSCFLGDSDPVLRRIVEPDEVLAQDIWLTLDPALAKVPRVRAVADWVVDTVVAKADVLIGRSARR